MLAGNGLMDNLSSGFAKGAKRLLGPISMLADVANVATAPPEERGRAVGSMIGGTAGTAIGSAIGSVLLPGIGTWVGGAVGGWAGSAAGGWIGDKAKDIGNFMSSATEGVGDALSGAADYVSEKTKKSPMAYPASLDLVLKKKKRRSRQQRWLHRLQLQQARRWHLPICHRH